MHDLNQPLGRLTLGDIYQPCPVCGAQSPVERYESMTNEGRFRVTQWRCPNALAKKERLHRVHTSREKIGESVMPVCIPTQLLKTAREWAAKNSQADLARGMNYGKPSVCEALKTGMCSQFFLEKLERFFDEIANVDSARKIRDLLKPGPDETEPEPEREDQFEAEPEPEFDPARFAQELVVEDEAAIWELDEALKELRKVIEKVASLEAENAQLRRRIEEPSPIQLDCVIDFLAGIDAIARADLFKLAEHLESAERLRKSIRYQFKLGLTGGAA